jgi:hypothetical protein
MQERIYLYNVYHGTNGRGEFAGMTDETRPLLTLEIFQIDSTVTSNLISSRFEANELSDDQLLICMQILTQSLLRLQQRYTNSHINLGYHESRENMSENRFGLEDMK